MLFFYLFKPNPKTKQFMEQTTTGAAAPARPGFLKVLCILSFIGTPLGLISGIMNYFTYKALAAGGDMLGSIAGSSEASEQLNQAMDSMASVLGGIDYNAIATGYIVVGLLNLIIFAGALMMWNLKKTGFYIYTLGQLAQVASFFLLIGGLIGGMMGVVTAIFNVAFIIMYAVNLKHLK